MSVKSNGLACAVVILALAAAMPAGAQCMLANPSFELGGSNGATFAGWSQFGIVGSSTRVVHGHAAARVLGPNTGGWDVSGYWQSQTCSPGQKWAVNLMALHTSAAPLTGGNRAIVNIEWRNSSGALISYESHEVLTPATPVDRYQPAIFTSGAAPAGTTSIHLLLGVLQSPTDPQPEVLYDNVNCDLVGPPTLESLQWGDFGSGRTVGFAGRTWRVKGPGLMGPGPNYFDNSANAVSVDGAGRLHLAIQKSGATWYSSEVVLDTALGYGDYVFTTRGRLDNLDPAMVAGIFLWQYGECFDNNYLWWNPYNEIDVEISRWGNGLNADAQFVAQPYGTAGNLSRFNVTYGDSELVTYAMRWLPDRVEYRCWRGDANAETPAHTIYAWTYAGPHVPRPEMPRVHLNLWQFNRAPLIKQEVVFDNFAFRPSCPNGDCITLDAPPAPASTALAFAPAMPNPVRSQTRLHFELPSAGGVEVALYDVAGRLVRSLVSGPVAAGAHDVVWDGRDDAGQRVASGVYLARVKSPGASLTRRVVVLE
jgi:hypothetical protein